MRWLVVLIATWAVVLSAHGAEKRVALVIGNAAYKSGPLTNPVNDARAMATRLRSLGFDVTLRENLKAREIGGTYREFRSKITPGATALVFYAGHGLQVRGQNYFPAVDADISGEEDVPLQSLNLGTLLDNMEEAKAGVSLVFLDACRDNPFARRFRSASRGLAKVEAASGTLIHYATKPGSVASDGDGKNGTYTEALLAQIGEVDLPVELMLKKVTNQVMARTKGKQEPWVEGSLRGDFYFSSQGQATGNINSSTKPLPFDPAHVELSFWDSIKSSQDSADFEEYLRKYPAGQFSGIATNRVRQLSAAIPPSVVSTRPPPSASPTVSQAAVVNPGLIAGRYRDNGDGTVTDVTTNLQWMRCVMGQTWNGLTCTGDIGRYSWEKARQLSSNFARAADWRLPTIDELKSLVYCSSSKPSMWNLSGRPCQGDYQRSTIVGEAFPVTPSSASWSDSPYANDSVGAWGVDFGYGSADYGRRIYDNSVRLVRGGQ